MSDISQKTIATPTTHYGAAKASTWGFIIQRVTGALNVVFTVFFIYLVVRLARAGSDTMSDILGNPLVLIVTAVMIISVALHMRIGMRDVIEDYVHSEKLNRLCLLLNTLFTVIVALATLAALAKLAFWG